MSYIKQRVMNDNGTFKDWQEVLDQDEGYQQWLDEMEAENEREVDTGPTERTF